MKAISLWEPWASLVRCKAKTIETRSWKTAYRGPLLICAAKKRVLYELNHLLAFWSFQGGLAPLVTRAPLNLGGESWPGVTIDDLNFGMAVAVVDLVDCKPTGDMTLSEIITNKPYGDFSIGRFGWKFENIQVIEPFPVKGHQGFFEVDYQVNQ